MLEILVILAILVGMAKRKGKYRKRLFAPRVSAAKLLATLADVTLISGDLSASGVNDRWFVMSAKLTWAIRNLTAGEGPIHVGLAHGRYTDAQVEEWIEATTSWDVTNVTAQEHSRRMCRHVGTFNGLFTEEVLNDGRPIKTPLRWMLSEGENIKFWAYNASGAALTTASAVLVNGVCFMNRA